MAQARNEAGSGRSGGADGQSNFLGSVLRQLSSSARHQRAGNVRAGPDAPRESQVTCRGNDSEYGREPPRVGGRPARDQAGLPDARLRPQRTRPRRDRPLSVDTSLTCDEKMGCLVWLSSNENEKWREGWNRLPGRRLSTIW